ncbi:non-ribosomal peptide synthetase [Nocardiopsis baichengensis]|uniref:non-ribosomal peptide synthetase n=1 Tax=Nocardiopsis baichengensis TaxID=280240 RepID=UPI00034D65D3|nr:non-ribosomal peptide synthetase [Nocardiopsis baichengensis]
MSGAEDRRRELLRRRLAEAGLGGGGGGGPAVGPRPQGAPAALSPAQRRMWFLQRLDPGGAAYNLCGAVRLDGPLDPVRLERALRRAVDRSEVLRTTYRADGAGGVEQVPAERYRLEVPVADSAAAGDRERRRAAEAGAVELGSAAFDLESEIPVRARLLRFAPDAHALLLAVHHIAFDDTSWGLLLEEIAEGYADGGAASPPPPLQYADYAHWQNTTLEQGRADEALAYWRSRLDPVPVPPALPTDLSRGPGPATGGLRRGRALPASTAAGLRALASAEHTTVATLVLALWKVLLHHYSGATDIVVGSPVVDRDRPELERLIGNLGNTLALRTEVDPDAPFRQVLARVARTCTDGYSHQELPFDRLVEEVRPPREPGRTALFDAVFSYVAAPPRTAEAAGVRFTELPVYDGTARFDLVLEAAEAAEGGLELSVTARDDLFVPATAERILGHMETLAAAVCADPGRRARDLPLLTAAEQELIAEWSRGPKEGDQTEPLARMVERQAARTPGAPAVVARGRTLTYAELDGAADRLAARLAALGAGPERTVGVHLHSSPELVVALLAVLKTGAAFIALDPGWPRARLVGVAGQARPVAVVTAADSPLDAGMPQVDAADASDASDASDAAGGAGTEDGGAGAGSVRRGPPRARMENAAYIVYTSGSTGAPKGAVIRHQAICNRLPWQAAMLGLGPDDAVLHKAPMSFDISVNEIFLPLVVGARLVVADPGGHGDAAHLLDLIERERVTFVYIVASMLDAMLDRGDFFRATRSLRHVWCGGEALTPTLYARFRERSAATMYHGYGPAEATIGVACRVYRDEPATGGITMGRPNPDTRIHVLDRRLRPVPVGVPGEIHIGGTPLARGYVGDPVRTAERFTADPFEPGARLYRTGDLARLRPDGQIEFLGRADNQVKVRGHRIELEEVEAALGRCRGVRQGVAAVHRDRIAAYCAPEHGAAPTADQVRRELRSALPESMVPATVTFLDPLPLTPSGKVDRAALPAPGPDRPSGAAPPRDGYERAVADAWCAALGAERVGVHDNFFDLGGHSLLLVRVQALLKDRLDRDVSMVDLYSHPTVAALAAHLAGSEGPAGDLDGAVRRARTTRAVLSRRRRAGGAQ